jgi:formylglycine-generating enzyme required for sulfatase activity
MVSLPAGSFVMGDNRGDWSEKPAHSVTIKQPFAIGKYEITVAQWNACVLAGGCARSPDIAGTASEIPVRDVSWSDAVEYVKWLGDKTGKPYRLPTEAEWEYAARGGTKTRYWWGNKFVKGKVNCKDCGGAYDHDSPDKIGSLDPNPFGLHDMTGGVWEWVQDCWHHDYKGAPRDGSAWSKDYCRVRVLRGGSWRNDSSYVHSASRFKYDQDVRYLVNGFRVALTLK